MWINPHIKGPDGAPLRQNRNVFLLDTHRGTNDESGQQEP